MRRVVIRMRISITFRLAAVIVLVLFSYFGQVKADEKSEILNKISRLRNVQPTNNKKKLEELNTAMDDAWKFAGLHKETTVPILTNELNDALTKQTPDQFFIL